ncbi:MAG: outer membrane protein assembly factor BamC [Methylococcales bacterium]|nr:outer membrane protein assembly factor BamC [Methylococcales bacterium]
MKIKLLGFFLCLNLSACGYNFFPDKEKDYQFTKEIPALIIPTDLSAWDTQNKQKSVGKQSSYSQNNVDNQDIKVTLAEYSGGATRIQIASSLERSWRAVGKALSRNTIEITNRNKSDNVYYIQYDPDFKKVEDGSLWDEVVFIFAADPAKEQEYRIKLAENGAVTEVIILDSEDKPLFTDEALKLLNLLYETIKADLASAK